MAFASGVPGGGPGGLDDPVPAGQGRPLTSRWAPGQRGPPTPKVLPGIVLAALAGLALGAVIGPEAPLIAMGSGLAAGAIRLIARRGLPEQGVRVVATAGSFAALSTVLGSPLSGAFLLMEASGLGGPILGLVLVPGLLAAGTGALTFIGFDAWTGHGAVSLAIVNLPPIGHPDGVEFGWAIGIGVAAAILGGAIGWLALSLKPHAEGRVVVLLPVAGLVPGHPTSAPNGPAIDPPGDRRLPLQRTEGTASHNRVYGTLTTALRPIHLSGRAGRHRASWTGQGADTTGQRSQICLGRTEKRRAKHFAPYLPLPA